MALFVIYGVQSCGKTHTAWLVYNLLKNVGKELEFLPDIAKPTFSEVLEEIRAQAASPKKIPGSDFRALFDY